MHRPALYLLTALVATHPAAAEPSLTIYNQRFAVIRDTIPLDLRAGTNAVTFTGATFHLEPDSVILRDPSGRTVLRILEQNYRAEPVSEGLLLNLFEGKELDFEDISSSDRRIVRGKVIRSGYVPHARGMRSYGGNYAANQMSYAQGGGSQPIIEVGGRLRFSLPGRPIFPALTNDAILKPTLDWRIHADRAAKLEAELSYLSGGLSWAADYNLIAPETGDKLEITGWITMDNQSGKDFPNARIKLVAGDVNKIQQSGGYERMQQFSSSSGGGAPPPPVTERNFDEYHLYTLPLATTLHDRETKQVEFLKAASVASRRTYIYDGARIDLQRYGGWDPATVHQSPEYGTGSNPKVWVMREFANTAANGLGIALPKGRTRFYRNSGAGALEFTGENNIDHTPRNETVRVYTGDAFDLVGERKRTDFKIDHTAHTIDESFEIRIRNRKKEPVEVRVVERLYRWTNWKFMAQSLEYTKKDARTVEFAVKVAADQEQVVTYSVRYSW